jgi:hypothetical protein
LHRAWNGQRATVTVKLAGDVVATSVNCIDRGRADRKIFALSRQVTASA